MPTAVACPKCKTKYSLPDQLLGKPVKCKTCNTMFKVAAPVAGVAVKKPASKTAAAIPQVNQAELARLGLDGPISRQPELFGEIPPRQAGNPLGNHVVVDPGFGEVESPVAEEKATKDAVAAIFKNPALESAKAAAKTQTANKKRKKKKRSLFKDEDEKAKKNQGMLLVGLGTLLALVATISMPLIMNIGTAVKIYAYGVLPLMCLLSLGVSAWWVFRCWQSRTSVGNFLLILIPLYIFVYSLNRDKLPWTKEPLISWAIMTVGAIAIPFVADFMGINEQWQKFIDAGVM